MIKRVLSRIREWNQGKYVGWILLGIFPFYLVFMTELNQCGSLDTVIERFLNTPTIFIFDVILIGLLFWLIQVLVKRAFVSGLILGGLLYILSCVEFYRYRASGAHFTFNDLSIVTNVGDVMQFADIQIYLFQIILFVSWLLYCAIFWALDTKTVFPKKYRVIQCSAVVCFFVFFFLFSGFSSRVYQVFQVEYGGVNNNFVLSEKFEKNGMIAFLIENLTDMIQNGYVQQPQDYSEDTMNTLSAETPVAAVQDPVKPNVITIMSESYADFRIFDQLQISDDFYQNFDRFCNEGYSGKAVVPTFGGYTVRTEFELIFGLPIKSLNSTSAPQKMISEQEQTTIPSFYQSVGYTTTYIHPYTSDFYDRGKLYPYYGFDNLYFDESFASAEYYRDYVDDAEVFEKAVEQIKEDDDPSYIHITTMQNHMPYGSDTQSQMDYYMDGIAHTDLALGELMDALEQLDEPTVVLFIGDHFPFFNDENNVYEQLGIDRYNCLDLYEQTYFVWSNYDLDFDTLGHKQVSSFYLPYLVIDAIGLEQSDLVRTMLEQLEVDDVYTEEMKPHYSNEVLDTVTYDLILGDQYSGDNS
jgi:phosphoglycerol transferase MdoB-like AlkP superfamily enzyme